jgi:hypothetical protein
MSLRQILFSCFVILLALPVLRAQSQAQSSSSTSASAPSTSASSSKPVTKRQSNSPLDSGSTANGIYRNPAFGFTCKIPDGWVLRTSEMNQQEAEDEKEDSGKKSTTAGQVLLAAFSRPPDARAEDVNGSILIAAESAASYPGLTDAAQYFGPLTEVAKARGFEIDDDPYEFVLGAKTLARGDFQKNVGTRVMRQSTLVILSRGYLVSFTFIEGTEDEVEELVQGLSFATARKASP